MNTHHQRPARPAGLTASAARVAVPFLVACTLALGACAGGLQAPASPALSAASAPAASAPAAATFDARRADWRVGPVTYQIFVDRFAPARDMAAKRHLYDAPRTLQPWDAQPLHGAPAPGTGVWTHELAFWGGDLDSVAGRLAYLEALGVEVVYLNPVHAAPSNHKYDATDFASLSPEYGTRADLAGLADGLHARGMRLVLDGVFNHVGSRHPTFLAAKNDAQSPARDWFTFDPDLPNGYAAWWGAANLPELNWNAEAVRDHVYAAPDAVVRSYLRDGIDGWRLDVATEIGPEILGQIRAAAHETRPGALVLGEVWNYPDAWTGALDGVMNFPLRALMFAAADGDVSGAQMGAILEDMIADTGVEPLLRSWLLLDNHDTPRLATLYPDAQDRRFLQALQFSLPGAPVLYYGVEAGMEGGEDPGSRGPMEWARAEDLTNPERQAIDALVALRQDAPALAIGDVRVLATRSALAFLRTTDRASETVLVIANPEPEPVTETLVIRDGRMMTGETFVDAFTGARVPMNSAVMTVTAPARSVMILQPEQWRGSPSGHNPYKRIP